MAKYLLQIFIKPAVNVVGHFNSPEHLDKAVNALRQQMDKLAQGEGEPGRPLWVDFKDDYGGTVRVDARELSGILRIELDSHMKAAVEGKLEEVRNSLRANIALKSDRTIAWLNNQMSLPTPPTDDVLKAGAPSQA